MIFSPSFWQFEFGTLKIKYILKSIVVILLEKGNALKKKNKHDTMVQAFCLVFLHKLHLCENVGSNLTTAGKHFYMFLTFHSGNPTYIIEHPWWTLTYTRATLCNMFFCLTQILRRI